jgi:hypothetical protein
MRMVAHFIAASKRCYSSPALPGRFARQRVVDGAFIINTAAGQPIIRKHADIRASECGTIPLPLARKSAMRG